MNRFATALCLVLASGAAVAQDLADCPLERLVLADVETTTLFTVDAVRSNATWFCNGRMRDTPPDGTQICGGPYGETILIGRISGPERKRFSAPVAMVHRATEGTPCCSWSAFSEDDPVVEELVARTSEQTSDRSITLATLGINTVEFDERSVFGQSYENNFGSLVPSECRAPETDTPEN